MVYTASKLRQNIYRLLSRVAVTGIPLSVNYNGKKLKIVSEEPVSKIARLKKRRGMRGDPESIVHMDWYREWKA